MSDDAGPYLIPGTGIFDDIDEAAYHADRDLYPELGRSLSSTGAKTILDCPARYAWQREHPPVKDVWDFGHVAHARLLGRGQGVDVIDADSWRTTDAKVARDESRAAGRVPILAADSDRADAVVAAVRAHPIAASILSEGAPERSIYWIDDTTGITCRGRIDWHHPRAIVDLKTAASASPERFARSAVDYGYAIQAAWYVEGWEALTGDRLPFVHVVVESEPPHLVTVVQLDDTAIEYGSHLAARAREVFAECESSQHWPAYTDDIALVSLPAWATQRGIPA